MKNTFVAIKFFILMTILTGIFYPLIVTIFAVSFFPFQANGSFIADTKGNIVGSELIAQKFTNPIYFWPRLSAIDYNPLPSGGSNIAVTTPEFQKQIATRKTIGFSNEMLTASGSGLDPHISIASAIEQVERIVTTRHWKEIQKQQLVQLIEKNALGRDFGVLGEPRINVLQLNIELDKIKPND